MTKLLYYKTYFAKPVNQNDDVRTKNALEYIKKKKKKVVWVYKDAELKFQTVCVMKLT